MIPLWRDRRWRRLWRLRMRSNPEASRRAFRSVAKALLYVTIIVASHTAAMVYFEKMSLGDALWLTATSITTVGYGDLSAASIGGRLATTFIIYFGGIFVVGKMAGDFFDYRTLRREAMKQGHWNWDDLSDHIVIVGSRTDFEPHLLRLFTECDRNPATGDRDIVLISNSFPGGIPSSFQDLDVKFVNGTGMEPASLDKAGVARAHMVVVLAWEEESVHSDGMAFDIVHRVREAAPGVLLAVECVDDGNRARLRKAGADLVIRPVRAYPEMIVGSLVHPGSHEILENLFSARDESIVREDVRLDSSWKDIVIDYVGRNQGVPVAYRQCESERVVTAPAAETRVSADAIYLLRRDED